jgi:hypothetical protein
MLRTVRVQNVSLVITKLLMENFGSQQTYDGLAGRCGRKTEDASDHHQAGGDSLRAQQVVSSPSTTNKTQRFINTSVPVHKAYVYC